ncbi:MAG: AraC family transcriptional regulator [Pseudomonadales bacterium]|jgi:AraC-like DNA-binding protein|uniref:helix-turn-helix domain-containing protein n=1 Tax=Halopseudomonas TaxID=2901189 RepID=UPI000C62CCC7|nr:MULTISPECIES: AraC family transcriptional regulator [Halopseudomonas]MAD27901.1 AraC family transcriptional regulator [Pseudomonadales bacterium]MEE2798459.1 AraC family transcriptional regulator [Pseudomonadota bacterium]HBT55975.1 AraC family transcriptional regulator [Pseudomonas sp.]MAH01251.1 AraC family transcriptional regulator [Pseudomonadales bacterium]MAK73656.1 AraC family transcriptional regulator [Pseudomonadales bacterium]|tara:strand:- start:1814 stop:2557 length:744 start_codon:yes stop_codon:yes gene_type:complete
MSTTRLDIHHYSGDAAAHTHEEQAQLVFGLQGTLELAFNNDGGPVQAGRVAIIAASDRHAFFSPDQGRCLVLDVDPDAPLPGLEPQRDSQLQLLEHSRLSPLTPAQTRLVSSLAGLIDQQPWLAEQSAALLLGSLLGQPAPARRLPLEKLNAFIEAHMAYPLEVADLARLSGLSSSRFNHWCLQDLGCTPLEYLRRRRLLRARQLLEHSRLPVSEIAARCGYGSQSAFTQAFRKHWQQSPSSLRKQH